MQIPFNPNSSPAGPARRIRRQMGLANLAPDIVASLQTYLAHEALASQIVEGENLAKRIVMNPPQSFLDASVAQGFGGGGTGGGHHMSGPINFGPGSQISIPNDGSVQNGQNPLMAPGALITGYPVVPPSMTDDDVATALMTDSTSNDLTTPAITSVATPTTSMSPTSITTDSSSLVSSSATSSAISSSTSLSMTSTSTSTSFTRSILLPSATQSPSASVTDKAHKDFTHTTLFIVLMVLSSLVIFGIIATSLSWCLRWKGKDRRHAYFGGPACCGRRSRSDPEDDVDAFDLLYAPSSHGSNGMSEVARGRGAQRSSLQDLADFGFPQMPAATRPEFEHGSPRMPASGPAMLQVCNALPDELEKGEEIEPPNTPRYLGVDRHLSTSWRRSTTGDSLPSPFLDPVSTHLAADPSRAISDLERSATQDTMPSHAGSWASNLRNTLFAAISTVQRPFSPGPAIDEDRFTRSVLPLHRRLSGMSNGSGVSRGGGQWATYNGRGLQVLEEKDDYNLPESDAEAIQSSWMDRLSRVSSHSSWTPSPRKPRMPLRGAVSPGLYETKQSEAWVPGGSAGTTRW